ncbi:MAG: cysteine peptidase family C39 domain-containing protein [Armatimonadota bacterium]|nr:cysteine peptidase family C39 domain-containing protein [Armatimonadota bacterium]
MRWRTLTLILTLWVVVFTVSLSAHTNTRYLVTQFGASDCGPAALATLLHYYLNIPTTAEEMTRLTKPHRQTGTSLLALEEAATAKGCAADSFRMSLDTLQEQLTTYPIPLIVRTLNPEPHFSVLLGMERDYVYLADPAIGNTLLRKQAFLRRWYLPGTQEGLVFIATRPDRVHATHRARVLQELAQQLRNLETKRLPHTFRR